jgi:hypothetical protein
MAEARAERGIDNERVRVITWTLEPGATIGRHTPTGPWSRSRQRLTGGRPAPITT